MHRIILAALALLVALPAAAQHAKPIDWPFQGGLSSADHNTQDAAPYTILNAMDPNTNNVPDRSEAIALSTGENLRLSFPSNQLVMDYNADGTQDLLASTGTFRILTPFCPHLSSVAAAGPCLSYDATCGSNGAYFTDFNGNGTRDGNDFCMTAGGAIDNGSAEGQLAYWNSVLSRWQPIIGQGTLGQVLKSNGPGQIPSFQNESSGGSPPGGTASELQYRAGASTFGAVAGSSVDVSGNITLGATIQATELRAAQSASPMIQLGSPTGQVGTDVFDMIPPAAGFAVKRTCQLIDAENPLDGCVTPPKPTDCDHWTNIGPADTDDHDYGTNNYAMQLTQIRCRAEGSATPSIALTFQECNSSGGACANTATVTCTDTWSAATITDASIAVDAVRRILYAAPSGTVEKVTFSECSTPQ